MNLLMKKTLPNISSSKECAMVFWDPFQLSENLRHKCTELGKRQPFEAKNVTKFGGLCDQFAKMALNLAKYEFLQNNLDKKSEPNFLYYLKASRIQKHRVKIKSTYREGKRQISGSCNLVSANTTRIFLPFQSFFLLCRTSGNVTFNSSST